MRHPLKIQNLGIGLVMGRIANALFRWARFAKARQGGLQKEPVLNQMVKYGEFRLSFFNEHFAY